MDVQIKYGQVIEQFTAEDVAPPELQALIESPELPHEGRLRASNVTLLDEGGTRVIDNVSFDLDLHAHVAIVGHQGGAGTSELAQLLARLYPPTSGIIEMGGIDITRAPEAVTGRALAYVGSPAYLFPTDVRGNMLYGLKHHPVREPDRDEPGKRLREAQKREALRTGNSPLDIDAEWIDYASAGVDGPEAMEARIVELLRVVELEETIFELGLRSSANDVATEKILLARGRMRERLEALDIEDWVERFDPERYNRNATLAENLLFGTPVGRTFDIDNLAGNPYVRQVLRETGLYELMLRTGHKVAETMVELFSGLPPGHEFFAQYSFIRQEDLPHFEAILQHVGELGLKGIEESERRALLALPFRLIATRHRLGLIDEGFEARVVEARRHFANNLPVAMRKSVEFFDPGLYNSAASLQDNILFGKIVAGQAGATQRITTLMRELLDELGLRPLVVRFGLSYNVGVGGARLASTDRQKIALVRALLKRPVVLILDHAAAVLDPASQARVVDSILAERRGRGVVWALSREEYAERFSTVLVMERGKLADQGRFAELKRRTA
jgi:ABC-type multidrug transport system ATPase subunit